MLLQPAALTTRRVTGLHPPNPNPPPPSCPQCSAAGRGPTILPDLCTALSVVVVDGWMDACMGFGLRSAALGPFTPFHRLVLTRPTPLHLHFYTPLQKPPFPLSTVVYTQTVFSPTFLPRLHISFRKTNKFTLPQRKKKGGRRKDRPCVFAPFGRTHA